MEPIYQCCYTNAAQNAGGRVTSGWQAVAVTPGIPGGVYETCVRLQNANASLCTDAVDEAGNALSLYEITGDGGYLYVVRTQFGLTDRLGRPNMYSHAVVFPLRDKRNPNFYLALDPSFFRREWDGLSPPLYEKSISLREAMDWAGLDRDAYATLVKCVYARAGGPRGGRPLYIGYDGTDRQLRGILHCIYSGTPNHVRKTLRVSSCPTANDGGKDLVFSRNARTRESYLIPRTGETNALPPRVQQRIDRYGYVDYAPRELQLEEFPAFFDNLDLLAAHLGDASGSNCRILRLAFQLWTHPDGESAFTDAELEGNLSDALRLPLSDSEVLERLLARLLKESAARGLRLTDENRELLNVWLRGAKTGKLREAGRGYAGTN